MQQKQFKDKYPVFYKDFLKNECSLQSVVEFLDYFQDKIERHERAAFIARFDHYSHTKEVNGDINPDIKNVQNIIMCFGWEIPSPDPIAVRPRSIGITEMEDKFVVNFMEAPNPVAQQTLIDWVNDIS
jgi:hypothetical protein